MTSNSHSLVLYDGQTRGLGGSIFDLNIEGYKRMTLFCFPLEAFPATESTGSERAPTSTYNLVVTTTKGRTPTKEGSATYHFIEAAKHHITTTVRSSFQYIALPCLACTLIIALQTGGLLHVQCEEFLFFLNAAKRMMTCPDAVVQDTNNKRTAKLDSDEWIACLSRTSAGVRVCKQSRRIMYYCDCMTSDFKIGQKTT